LVSKGGKMQKLQVSPEVNNLLRKGTALIVYSTMYLVGLTLALGYITQTEVVLEPRSTLEGYCLLMAVTFLVGSRLFSWLKSRKKG